MKLLEKLIEHFRPVETIIPDHTFKHLEDEFKAEGNTLLVNMIRQNRKASKKLKRKFVDPSPGVCQRFTYDAQNTETDGVLVLEEHSDLTDDEIVNLGHENANKVREYFAKVLGYDSYDDMASDLRSRVHYGKNYLNAFFDGEKMTYGDGDGLIFLEFARSLDVAAHEIGHGFVQALLGLVYWFDPGALNEHLADVIGVTCRQFHEGNVIPLANWFVGDTIVGPQFPGQAIRTFRATQAYKSDPQPKHNKNKYRGFEDNGGVHINSGIFNHLFFLVCMYMYEAGLVEYSYEVFQRVWLPGLIVLSTKPFKQYSTFGMMKDALLEGCPEDAKPHLTKALAEVGL